MAMPVRKLAPLQERTTVECAQQEYERLERSEDVALQAQKAEDGLAKARPAIAHYLRLAHWHDSLQS